MAKDKKEKGLLSKTFWGAAKLVTIGVAAAVAWQIFLDPIFMPVFHDTTNPYAMAWMQWIGESFSWIPRHLGMTPEPGLLSDVFNDFLAPEIASAQAKIASSSAVAYTPPPIAVAEVIPELDFSFGT